MAFIVKDAVREPLYAIVPYFNPWRWKAREKHTLRAIKHFADAGAVVVLVEVAFNRREFAFEDCGLEGTLAECNVLGDRKFQHRYIGLRTKDELWLKENSIKVAVARALPWDWQQVAWIDGDVHFVRPNWVGEAIHKLQHYKFLQLFSHARDLGPNYEMLPSDYPMADGESWAHAWLAGTLAEKALSGVRKHHHHRHHHRHHHCHHHPHHHHHCPPEPPEPPEPPPYPYGRGRVWPGLAWACTRQAWDEVGGLLDFAIWGGGDWHMAHALIDEGAVGDPPAASSIMRKDLHPNYQQLVMAWTDKCRRHIRRNVGVMDGSVVHNWHGRKTERGYNEKHGLLASIGFDPIAHLKHDYQGIYQLHDDGSEAFVALRDMMRALARERNEDSIDT